MTRVGAAVLFVCVLALPAGAQERVRTARMVADLSRGDGSADVHVAFVLSGDAADDSIGATALSFAGATVSVLRSDDDGRERPLGARGALAGTVALPVTASADGARSVRASYRVPSAVVERGGAVRGHVPVLSLDRLPERTRPDLFEAEVRIPPSWRIVEGFPTGMRATGEPGVYLVDLAVVPALISFRGRTDGAWRPGLPLVLDAVGIVLLLAFSAVGWRHLRSRAA